MTKMRKEQILETTRQSGEVWLGTQSPRFHSQSESLSLDNLKAILNSPELSINITVWNEFLDK